MMLSPALQTKVKKKTVHLEECTVHISLEVQIQPPLLLKISIPVRSDFSEYFTILKDQESIPSCLLWPLAEVIDSILFQQKQSVCDNSGLVALLHADPTNTARAWSGWFRKECLKYAPEVYEEEDELYTRIFHELIHSPSAMTLLKMEKSYAVAMRDFSFSSKQYLTGISVKHEQELKTQTKPMVLFSRKTAEEDEEAIKKLKSKHGEELDTAQKKLDQQSSELKRRQRLAFRDWVLSYYNKDPTALEDASKVLTFPDSMENSNYIGGHSGHNNHRAKMEESFSVHFGAQLRESRNLRLVCLDFDQLYHYDHRYDDELALRTMTAMNLYSSNLKGLVLPVNFPSDGKPTYEGLYRNKAARQFVSMCNATSEFHFHPLKEQLDEIFASIGSLDLGDVYITRHSNLAEVHVVFHLVVDKSIWEPNLTHRSPMLLGLRNILSIAGQHSVVDLTVPLLLTHYLKSKNKADYIDELWCLRRGELVLKCVKGFMLDCTSWAGLQDTQTVQFLIPKQAAGIFEGVGQTISETFKLSTPLTL